MKKNRQEKILELIRNQVYITQDDLQNELESLGYNVTQSTISRDIKELRITKGHDSFGNYRYVVSEEPTKVIQSTDHYRDLFSRSVKSVEYSLNNVVVKCFTGMASGACVAIDELYGEMMLGSLAGDDTIIIVTKSEEQSVQLCFELNKLL